MKEFMEKFYETRDTWLDLLDNVNAYVFGEEELDEDMFADAMRGAFEVFAKMYSLETVKVIGNSETLGANHLMTLIGTMQEYAADRYTEDSENIVFRASQLATRLLVNGAVNDFCGTKTVSFLQTNYLIISGLSWMTTMCMTSTKVICQI